LVESEASTYYSEIYPFFLVQNHRANDGDYGPTHLHIFMKRFSSKDMRWVPRPQLYLHSFKNESSYEEELKPAVPYYLVEYDEFTKRFVDLLQNIRDLRRYVRMDSHGLNAYRLLVEYTGDAFSFIAYHDYFLTDQPEPIVYKIDVLFKLLPFIVNVTSKYSVDPAEANYTSETRNVKIIGGNPDDGSRIAPPDKVDEFKEMQAKAVKLEEWIKRPEFATYRKEVLDVPVTPVLLDKKTALPYRVTAFDKKIGLYNTAQKQKQLYKGVFGAVLPCEYEYRGERRKEFIDKYSNQVTPLQCSVCEKDTFNVDMAKSIALCSLECRDMLK
jgi:hypothetical protein